MHCLTVIFSTIYRICILGLDSIPVHSSYVLDKVKHNQSFYIKKVTFSCGTSFSDRLHYVSSLPCYDMVMSLISFTSVK